MLPTLFLSRPYVSMTTSLNTGLRFDDIKNLLAVVHKLFIAGNTLMVVQHNLT